MPRCASVNISVPVYSALEGEARAIANREIVGRAVALKRAAFGREPAFAPSSVHARNRLRNTKFTTFWVSGIAIFDRDLLRQNIDARDGLGGNFYARSPAAGNAMPLQQDQGRLTPLVPRDLGRQFRENFGYAADPSERTCPPCRASASGLMSPSALPLQALACDDDLLVRA
jgi:hypothetical protein